MNSVYTVVSIKNGAELDTCEVYADIKMALGRAFALSHFISMVHPEWVVKEPKEEILPDNSLRWIFLDTSLHYVAVFHKKVLQAIPSRRDTLESLKNLNNNIVQNKSKDNQEDRSLAVGWTFDNKAVTMQYLWDYPSDVKYTWDLYDNQKLALVTARINKRPNFSVLTSKGTFIQSSALLELKNKTEIAKEIIEMECNWLDYYHNLRDYETSSSEESSE